MMFFITFSFCFSAQPVVDNEEKELMKYAQENKMDIDEDV
jgi:hypothetical protein